MSNATPNARGACVILGAAELPRAISGDSICSAIERAVVARDPSLRYTADVRVAKASMLSAALTVNGRKLPDQKFAVMDKQLDQSAVERFAEAVAEALERAAKA